MGAYGILNLVEIGVFGYVFFAKSMNRHAINTAGFISAVVGSWALCMWVGEHDTDFLPLACAMAFNVLILVLIKVLDLSDAEERRA